ncbi:MAG: selenocysteine-specific translation elongation factor [Caldilineaceae bacterium]|nr:selenocysteine-specific translation elongation factor [Caldilineaceae bacterium]
MRVLSTAGHVDHGKSALVQALTGTDPDRLAEEKRRGLTIELGYAFLDSDPPDPARRTGLVDVPGHLDFIRNMLAGLSGIDAAILVVAADDGVMPQTREHLSILDLLRVPACLPVLSKVDAVEDPEWLELVELDLADHLAQTRYADAAILRVSAHEGIGLEDLRQAIFDLPERSPEAVLDQPARLHVDRVFVRSGFGTVVTGTLSAGTLELGQTVGLQPSGLIGRIRGLQSYHETKDRCVAGARVAVNISGVSHGDVQRGDALCTEGTMVPSRLADVKVELLSDAFKGLEHNLDIMLFHGTTETIARVRLIGAQVIEPGRRGYCQLVLSEPMVLDAGDRFIVRLPSPSVTLGGGEILDPAPDRHWKRFHTGSLERFRVLDADDFKLQLDYKIRTRPLISQSELLAQAGTEAAQWRRHLEQEIAEGRVWFLESSSGPWLVPDRTAREWWDFAEETLGEWHRTWPLRPGQPRGEFLARLTGWMRRRHQVSASAPQLNAAMAAWHADDRIVADGDIVRLPDHKVKYSPEQARLTDRLTQTLEAAEFLPPNKGDVLQMLEGDQELLDHLLVSGQCVALDQDVIFLASVHRRAQEAVLRILDELGSVTMAQVRDRLPTSRKYAQALLERMDQDQLTRRAGNLRTRA